MPQTQKYTSQEVDEMARFIQYIESQKTGSTTSQSTSHHDEENTTSSYQSSE